MTTKTSFDGVRWNCRIDPVANVAETLNLPSTAFTTLAVKVPLGGTVKIEFSASSVQDIEEGQGFFSAANGLAAGGVVTANLVDSLDGPVTAIRVTASADGGRVELVQAG
jgi:hypothetical protein